MVKYVLPAVYRTLIWHSNFLSWWNETKFFNKIVSYHLFCTFCFIHECFKGFPNFFAWKPTDWQIIGCWRYRYNHLCRICSDLGNSNHSCYLRFANYFILMLNMTKSDRECNLADENSYINRSTVSSNVWHVASSCWNILSQFQFMHFWQVSLSPTHHKFNALAGCPAWVLNRAVIYINK